MKSSSNSTEKEKRKVVRTTIELTKEIVAKYENGVRVSDLAAQRNMAKSTISTFLKNKEAIKAADVANGLTIVHSKQRPQIMDDVENLMLILIKELDGDSISEGIICEKALRIYADLLKDTPSMSAEGESGLTFKARRGWLEKKLSTEVESTVLHSMERRSAQTRNQLEKYVGVFHDFVNAGGYLCQNVLHCDESVLLWKKMPNMTYITKEEKPMTDRTTILRCAYVSVDCKIKRMVIYHWEKP